MSSEEIERMFNTMQINLKELNIIQKMLKIEYKNYSIEGNYKRRTADIQLKLVKYNIQINVESHSIQHFKHLGN